MSLGGGQGLGKAMVPDRSVIKKNKGAMAEKGAVLSDDRGCFWKLEN